MSYNNSKQLIIPEEVKSKGSKKSRDESHMELKQDDSDCGKENDKDFESQAEEEQINIESGGKKKETSGKAKEKLVKFRAINIKSAYDCVENDTSAPQLTASNTGEIDLKHFILISLKKEVYSSICEREVVEKEELNQICSSVQQ